MLTIIMLLKHTLWQFIMIFAVFIVGGLLLTLLARWMNNSFRQFQWPKFGLYAFGAIGVPIHELSHAIFCKVFFHDVKKIKWFDPAGKGGATGAVTHQYNPWNLYHRIGHFFIGFGPAIFGSFLMGVLFYTLIPQGRDVLWLAPAANSEPGYSVFILKILRAIFNHGNSQSLRFYIFAYLALCISSQIELSPEDLKQATKGVLPILLTLFIGNLIAWLVGANWHAQVMNFGRSLTASFSGVFAFAAILATICLVFCTIFFGLLNTLFGKNGVNPFRDSVEKAN